MRHSRFLVVGAPMMAAALACHSAAGPARTVSVGLIDPGGGLAQMSLVVPETATVAVPTPVQASTWGDACSQADTTDLQVAGLLADITLYDRNPSSGACARDLQGIARALTITFSVPGEATVRLHGRSLTDTTTVSATLTVRP